MSSRHYCRAGSTNQISEFNLASSVIFHYQSICPSNRELLCNCYLSNWTNSEVGFALRLHLISWKCLRFDYVYINHLESDDCNMDELAGCYQLATCEPQADNQNITAYGLIFFVSLSLSFFFFWVCVCVCMCSLNAFNLVFCGCRVGLLWFFWLYTTVLVKF